MMQLMNEMEIKCDRRLHCYI